MALPLTLAVVMLLTAPAEAGSPAAPASVAVVEEAPSSVDDPQIEGAVASVFATPYADAGDALEVCCAAAYCTFVGINECSLLTPEGKILAMMTATVGGLGGFMGGVGAGFALYYAIDTAVPSGTGLDPYKGGDLLLTLAFLSGAVGIVVGGVTGAMAAFAADAIFLQPPPPPRRRRYDYRTSEVPPAERDAPAAWDDSGASWAF